MKLPREFKVMKEEVIFSFAIAVLYSEKLIADYWYHAGNLLKPVIFFKITAIFLLLSILFYFSFDISFTKGFIKFIKSKMENLKKKEHRKYELIFFIILLLVGVIFFVQEISEMVKFFVERANDFIFIFLIAIIPTIVKWVWGNDNEKFFEEWSIGTIVMAVGSILFILIDFILVKQYVPNENLSNYLGNLVKDTAVYFAVSVIIIQSFFRYTYIEKEKKPEFKYITTLLIMACTILLLVLWMGDLLYLNSPNFTLVHTSQQLQDKVRLHIHIRDAYLGLMLIFFLFWFLKKNYSYPHNI